MRSEEELPEIFERWMGRTRWMCNQSGNKFFAFKKEAIGKVNVPRTMQKLSQMELNYCFFFLPFSFVSFFFFTVRLMSLLHFPSVLKRKTVTHVCCKKSKERTQSKSALFLSACGRLYTRTHHRLSNCEPEVVRCVPALRFFSSVSFCLSLIRFSFFLFYSFFS